MNKITIKIRYHNKTYKKELEFGDGRSLDGVVDPFLSKSRHELLREISEDNV